MRRLPFRARALVLLVALAAACKDATDGPPATGARATDEPIAAGAPSTAAPPAVAVELAHTDRGAARLPSSGNDGADELTHLLADLERRDARIRALEGELQGLREDRIAREREWLEYTQGIARLSAIAGQAQATFQPLTEFAGAPIVPATGDLQAPPDAPAPSDPSKASRLLRDAEIVNSVRALFVAEQVTGLELLEGGQLAGDVLGPVVIRTRDDLGRPTGSLCAERLRFEASLAARSVTLVLEEGFERRGDERLPFPAPAAAADARDAVEAPALKSGVRRIELPHVDPRPWIEAVPELFRPADREPPPDDGRWELLGVRAALNTLLRQDAEGGTWRLAGLAGVEDGVLRDVQLDQLDRDGWLEKKLFADRLVIRAEARGVRLELESGAVVRGDAKTPFLDGRYRIFLPRADHAEWRAAGLPGLSEPPPRARR